MTTLDDQQLMAERLHAVTQRVGFVLRQLQELEGASAYYYVLVVQAKPGMGLKSGQSLVDKAQSKTFGSTITADDKGKSATARGRSKVPSPTRREKLVGP